MTAKSTQRVLIMTKIMRYQITKHHTFLSRSPPNSLSFSIIQDNRMSVNQQRIRRKLHLRLSDDEALANEAKIRPMTQEESWNAIFKALKKKSLVKIVGGCLFIGGCMVGVAVSNAVMSNGGRKLTDQPHEAVNHYHPLHGAPQASQGTPHFLTHITRSAGGTTVQVAIPVPQHLLGGHKDHHGCCISCGFSWNEKSQQCERPWEHKSTQ